MGTTKLVYTLIMIGLIVIGIIKEGWTSAIGFLAICIIFFAIVFVWEFVESKIKKRIKKSKTK